jgi:hypothetical protein
MPYAITYPSHDALNVALTTDTAGDAAKIARQLIEKGFLENVKAVFLHPGEVMGSTAGL